jgi:hypothetical protein
MQFFLFYRIAPGPVDTPMLRDVMEKAGDVEGITKAMIESNVRVLHCNLHFYFF